MSLKQSAIHVLLVEDHAMMRQGLRTVLESYADVEVVGEAANGKEAVEAVSKLLPDLVVMDINMPVIDGIEATRHIKTQYPDVIVIGLSVNANNDNQAAMSASGAAMLMAKEAAVEHLYSAMRLQLKSKY